MRCSSQTAPRTSVAKLADIFCKVIDVVLTDRAVAMAPCNGLSRPLWEGALFIQRHPFCSIRDLAEGLGVSHPAAVKMVERLVRKELVERRASAHDRRVVELSLSPLGQQCVDSVRSQRGHVLESYMAELTADEQEALFAGLQSFLSAALTDGETAEAVCLHCGREHVEECLVNRANAGG